MGQAGWPPDHDPDRQWSERRSFDEILTPNLGPIGKRDACHDPTGK